MISSKNTNVALLLLSLIIPFSVSSIFLHMSDYMSVYKSNSGVVYNIIYISVTTLSALFFSKAYSNNYQSCFTFNLNIQKIIIYILFILVYIGLFLHLYDKIVLRGYNYVDSCVYQIRGQWLADGAKRTTIASSWQSALGYILTFLHFPLAWILIGSDKFKTYFYKLVLCILSLLPVTILAYTINSRSIILFVTVHFIACIIYWIAKKPERRTFIYSMPLSIIAFSIFLSFAYFTMKNQIYCGYEKNIANANANANANASAPHNDRENFTKMYFNGYLDELKIVPKNKLSTNDIGDITNTLNLILLYANNGAWNFEYILHQNSQPGTVLFSQVLAILQKFKLISKRNTLYRNYGKGMLSLVGTIWYDFSLVGLIIFGVIHGLIFVLISQGMCSKKMYINIISGFGFVSVIIVGFFSPLVFAVNLMAFPFFILSYLVFAIVLYLSNKHYWKNVSE